MVPCHPPHRAAKTGIMWHSWKGGDTMGAGVLLDDMGLAICRILSHCLYCTFRYGGKQLFLEQESAAAPRHDAGGGSRVPR